eukprot:SAG11_NODE_9993_length_864_cov_0.512418_1_plen_195_part_00
MQTPTSDTTPPGLETLIRRVHPDTAQDATLSVGYIYCLLDPDGRPAYVGSCRNVRCRGREACLARRMSSHRNQAARDPNSSPLYRSAGGSMEHWKMIRIRTVEWDDERLPLTLMKEEEHVRCTMGIVFDLHNHNRAVDPVQRRREYMKAWRIAHGQGAADSYMAIKSREARERRRALLQNEASESEPLATTPAT